MHQKASTRASCEGASRSHRRNAAEIDALVNIAKVVLLQFANCLISLAMQVLDSSRNCILELSHFKASADIDAERKQVLGQFLTPQGIGSFMASLFQAQPGEIRLLDAGAGVTYLKQQDSR